MEILGEVLHLLLDLLAFLLCVAAVRAIVAGQRAAALRPTFDYQVDPDRARQAAEDLSALVACETVSSPEGRNDAGFEAFHALLRQRFHHFAAAAEYNRLPDGVFYLWRGAAPGAQPLVLLAHTDVVAAGPGWTHDPFGGEISDGRVWGRGAADTKCTLYGLCRALDDLAAEGFVPPRDIYFYSSWQEELGGGCPEMAQWLQQHGVSPLLVLDEGGTLRTDPYPGVSGLFAMVGVTEKGYCDARLTARAAGGHSSAPVPGTPLVRLGQLMASAERHPPFRRSFSPQLRAMLDALTPYMSFGHRLLFANLWLFGPLVKRYLPAYSSRLAALLGTTCAFTMAHGSEGRNVLPAEAWVNANLRVTAAQGVEASLARLRVLADRCGAEVQPLRSWEASPVTGCDTRGWNLVLDALQQVYPGAAAVPFIMPGATDSRDLAPLSGACLRFGPVWLDQTQLAAMHAADENVSADALVKCADFYRALLERLD